MIDLFGISIHDPDVVFTDLGLAILGAYLGRRLWRVPGRGSLGTAGVIIIGGLASAALWGAAFHGFFPGGTGTPTGFVAWMAVAGSILVVAATLLELGLRVIAPRMPRTIGRGIVVAYAMAFAAVVGLVDESFSTIVGFYGPALVFFLLVAAWKAARSNSAGWRLVALSFLFSAVAAVLQQTRVSIHPDYFDHNAVYHVVQGVALVVLYAGFRRLSEAATVPA